MTLAVWPGPQGSLPRLRQWRAFHKAVERPAERQGNTGLPSCPVSRFAGCLPGENQAKRDTRCLCPPGRQNQLAEEAALQALGLGRRYFGLRMLAVATLTSRYRGLDLVDVLAAASPGGLAANTALYRSTHFLPLSYYVRPASRKASPALLCLARPGSPAHQRPAPLKGNGASRWR